MLWVSQFSRIIQVGIILPLAIIRFSSEELAVWLIFEILSNLQHNIDFGFTPTFSRAVAIASTGAKNLGNKTHTKVGNAPNLELLGRIVCSMRIVYLRLTVIVLSIFAAVGTLLLIKPIGGLSHPIAGWTAWATIVMVTGITLLGKSHVAYLQGMDKIALINRCRVITTLCASGGTIAVFSLGGDLFAITFATQFGLLIFVLILWFIRHRHQINLGVPCIRKVLDLEVFNYVWPASWRSGLGKLFGLVMVQVTGIIYAQLLSPAGASSYLLAFRLIYAIRQFSVTPFRSQIPKFNQFRATRQYKRMIELARNRMFLTYLVLAFGVLTVGLAGPPLMKIARKDTQFPPGSFWSLLGLATFVERYAAMHIQLYSTTNHIIWHITNGVTGVLFVSLSLPLYYVVGIYAYPLAMLVANLGFHSWYAAKHSYAEFGLNLLTFDAPILCIPTLLLVVYLGYYWF